MSWKFVFNSNHSALVDFEKIRALVATTGYNFFTFNGEVYGIDGKETGIKVTALF